MRTFLTGVRIFAERDLDISDQFAVKLLGQLAQGQVRFHVVWSLFAGFCKDLQGLFVLFGGLDPKAIHPIYLSQPDAGFQADVAKVVNGQGDLSEDAIAWKTKKGMPRTPSPLLVDGLIYTLADNGTIHVVDNVILGPWPRN